MRQRIDTHRNFTNHVTSRAEGLPHVWDYQHQNKNEPRTGGNDFRVLHQTKKKGQLYNAAHTHTGQSSGERLHTFKLPTMICNAYDFSNQPSFYVTTTTSFHFFDFDPKPPATSLLTCNVVTLKSIPRMPNDIAPRVFPYKSFQLRPLPSFTVPIPLHSPNLQSIALCSTFDDLIFGHGQPTQTPKK